MTDPSYDRATDADVLATYSDLAGWDTLVAAGHVAPVTTAAVDQSLAAVAAERTAESATDPLAQRGTRSARRRRLVLASGLVAAVTASALLLPTLLRAPSASAEAATLLTHAADAIHFSDPAARPGQWWRIESRGTALTGIASADKRSTDRGPSAWLVEVGRTEYVAVDGSQPSVFVDAPGRVVRRLAGPPDADRPALGTASQTWTTGLAPAAIPAGWQQPSPAWLAALPRGTAALRDRLYSDSAGQGRSRDGEAFVYVADLLRSGVVPADLRGALYRVLATVPGVEVTSSHAAIGDADGVGLGFFEAVDGTRQEIVVDPATGELVGERTVAVEVLDGIAAGTVVGSTTWSRTVVDEVPASVRSAAVDQNCTASADGGVSCQPTTK